MQRVMLSEVNVVDDGSMKVVFTPQGPAAKDRELEDDATFCAAIAGVCLLAREAGLSQTLRDLRAGCKDVLDNSI